MATQNNNPTAPTLPSARQSRTEGVRMPGQLKADEGRAHGSSGSGAKPKVLLAIQSQFGGHLARGIVYYQLLKDKYDVSVVTVGRPPAAWFPDQLGTTFEHFWGLYMDETPDGGINQWGTAGVYIGNTIFGRLDESRTRLRIMLDELQPEFVVSDFEAEVSEACFERDIPVLTVDGHRRMFLPGCPKPPLHAADLWDYFCMRVGIAFLLRWGTTSVAVSLLPMQSTLPNVVICPPLLRQSVLEKKPSAGEHLLIYHNSGGAKEEVLRQCRNLPTIVYGYGGPYQIGEIQFKPMSADGFIADLAGCRAYATRAGLESVAEALYFGKPTYVVPQKGQYEQTFNAYHASLLGAQMAPVFDYRAAFENSVVPNMDREWLRSGRQIMARTLDDFAARWVGRRQKG